MGKKVETYESRRQSSHLKYNNHSKVAFTLAEVLITLGIIGIVAALTLPMFIEKINEQVKEKRIENIKQKLSKVTDKMASLEVLQGHISTHDFVYEMKNHMNIAKICENNEIAACWPTPEVDLGLGGGGYDISEAKTGQSLSVALNDLDDNWDDTMGIVTADGISMIISYNTNCSYSTDANGLAFDKDSGTSSSLASGCLAIAYDYNGGSRPNKVLEDVQFLGNARTFYVKPRTPLKPPRKNK